MDCKEFREKHVAYVDDVLSGIEMTEMQRHVQGCCRCARHDTGVRRGLMLARNLPQIQPSADFMERLNLRLRDIDPLETPALAGPRGLSTSFALVAASVLAVAALATALTVAGSSNEPMRLAPVVASIPADEPGPVASPAVVASLATGIPLWPAVFMVNQAPVHMVNVDLREER